MADEFDFARPCGDGRTDSVCPEVGRDCATGRAGAAAQVAGFRFGEHESDRGHILLRLGFVLPYYANEALQGRVFAQSKRVRQRAHGRKKGTGR